MITKEGLNKIFKNDKLLCSNDIKELIDCKRRYVRDKLLDKIIEKRGTINYYEKEDMIKVIIENDIKPTQEYYKKLQVVNYSASDTGVFTVQKL